MNHSIRQQNALRSARADQRTAVNEWRRQTHLRLVPPPERRRMDRLAEIAQRFHDESVWPWVIASGIVLAASAIASIAILTPMARALWHLFWNLAP